MEEYARSSGIISKQNMSCKWVKGPKKEGAYVHLKLAMNPSITAGAWEGCSSGRRVKTEAGTLCPPLLAAGPLPREAG